MGVVLSKITRQRRRNRGRSRSRAQGRRRNVSRSISRTRSSRESLRRRNSEQFVLRTASATRRPSTSSAHSVRSAYSQQCIRRVNSRQSIKSRHSIRSIRSNSSVSSARRTGRFLLRGDNRYSEKEHYTESLNNFNLTVECFRGNYTAVENILDTGEDPDRRDVYGDTPLTVACAKGHYDIVVLLIQEDANVNKRNKEGWTPLMIASQNGDYKIIRELAENSALIDLINNFGMTSLMLASRDGHMRVVEFLSEQGADLNLANKDGTTALILASSHGHEEIVRTLIHRGADKHLRNKNGATALDIVKTKRRKESEIERILGDQTESVEGVQASVEDIAAAVGLNIKLLDQPFSEDLLVRIASLIPNWLEYADPLKIGEQAKNGINTDPQLNYRLKTQELLKTWHKKFSYSSWGHYRVLVDISCELGQADVAGKICEVLKENSLLPSDEDPGVAYISRDLKIFTKASIGGGAFGSVFKGELTGEPCAVKVLNSLASEIRMSLPTAVLANSDTVERFKEECECLKSFKHPNIVQHLATETHPKSGHFVLVLELMDCNLRQFFSIERELKREIQRSICHNIISALVYIHCRQIVHRDLCADNILLDCKASTPIAKISDFGMSRIVSKNAQSITLPALGKRGYLPPEAFTTESSHFDPSFDIFQFGVLVLQIMSHLPTIRSKHERDNELEKLQLSHPFKPLIEQCLTEECSQRPLAIDLERQLTSLSTV